LACVVSQAGFSTEAGQLGGRARRRILIVQENSMIARYTDHAANERTFLAWIRTGLAVIAFGFFLVKLNVFFDVTGGGSPLRPVTENAGAFVAVAARYAGLAMVVTGIAIIGRSSAGFERTRRAIDRDEVIRMPQSHAETLLSVAVAIAVAIFCVYLAVL
jgi:putative membrane protein